MAMGLSRPDNSRARPSSLLKRNEDYKRIFSASTNLEIYLWLAKAQKAVDAFLLSEEAAATAQERTNVRFHLATGQGLIPIDESQYQHAGWASSTSRRTSRRSSTNWTSQTMS